MALFGGDMIQVQTPDGRQISMPADLAASFPALQPPPIPSAPQPQPLTPQDQADLAAANPPPPNPTDAPVVSPAQVPPGGPPAGPVTQPGQATDAGRANAAQPVTNERLQKMGSAGAANLELGAQEGQRAAVERQGEAQANQATAVGSAMAAADAHAAQLLEQRRQAAEANAKALQAKTDEYLRNAKAIADTRVDRSVDHPILAAISVALSGIGSAMKHESTNPGLDALYKAIDRKVAGQMQDLDRRRADLGTQRDALGMQRESGRDRLAEMDTHRLAYLEQAKRQIAAIQQLTSSDVIRANSGVLLADIGEKQAQTIGSAQAREQQRQDAATAAARTERMHQQTLGVQMRGQDLQQSEADLNRAERSQEKLDAIAAQIAARKDTVSAELAKKVSEQAVLDPSTGDPMLTPDGQKKLADADAAEAKARAADDPGQAKKLNEYASTLRASAQQNDIALTLNSKKQEEAQRAANSAQKASNAIDSARRLIGAGPSAFDREQWAKIKVDVENAKAFFATELGEKLSVRALEAFDHVLSIDPDSLWSRTVDKGKAVEALGSLEHEINQSTDVALKGAGIKSGWLPAKRPNQVTLEGVTAPEIVKSGRPATGVPIDNGIKFDPTLTYIQNITRNPALAYDQSVDDSEEPALARTGSINPATGLPAPPSNYGLDPDVDGKVRAELSRAKTAGNAEYGRIADTLAQPLASDRPGFAVGIAKLIRDEDPKFYATVMSRLAATKGEQTAKELDAAIAVPAPLHNAGRDLNPPAFLNLSPAAAEQWRKVMNR